MKVSTLRVTFEFKFCEVFGEVFYGNCDVIDVRINNQNICEKEFKDLSSRNLQRIESHVSVVTFKTHKTTSS